MNWTRFSARARKYLFALAGIGAFVALDHLGITLPGFAGFVMEVIIGLAVAEGVYQVPNQPDGPDGSDQFRGV